MPVRPHITPALFEFFEELKENNDRDWFAANKARFESDVQLPLLDFIADFEPYLKTISPHYLADARKQGGSLFRIYRDTRFGHDKRPYKENAGVHFRHAQGKNAHVPGFYLHLATTEIFAGVGIWRPDGPTLKCIREAIEDRTDEWQRVKKDKKFTAKWKIDHSSALKRPPRGYAADHPMIEDLLLKDHVAFVELTREDVCKPGFIKTYADLCARSVPYARFLTEAVGMPF